MFLLARRGVIKMVLKDPEQIRAAMVPGKATVTAITLNTANVIDNEVLKSGLVRHIRRIVLYNLDDAMQLVTFATGDGTNGQTTLKKTVSLINEGYMVLEPHEWNEDVLKYAYATSNTRLHAYLGTAPTLGVDINIDYYDDLD